MGIVAVFRQSRWKVLIDADPRRSKRKKLSTWDGGCGDSANYLIVHKVKGRTVAKNIYRLYCAGSGCFRAVETQFGGRAAEELTKKFG